MPSFNKFYNEQQLTFKASFQAYLIDNKIDPDKIWLQIKKIIREVFELNNAKMRFHLLNYKNPTSFFELIRFDFLIDSDYKVYLMEANMSPNLSSGHFKPNALLYEQVLMNVFSLVGLSRHLNEIQER
jgi:tubulin monoglycylase TTLL15